VNSSPIGVFDSGVGGLSVAREIRRRLPGEDLLYFADTAFCPYGGRPLVEIRARSVMVVDELVGRGAKLVVVACNTASGAALETLREAFSIPIVGLEPAVKPATQRSRNGRVGVLATAATLRTERFYRLVEMYGQDVEIHPQAGPELVDLVEAGEIEGPVVQRFLSETLAPLVDADVDTVVLGCTHYPFLRQAIAEVLGPGVEILDSGEAVARQVERVLRDLDGLAPAAPAGELQLLTNGDHERVAGIATLLWGEPIRVHSLGQLRSEGARSSLESTR
jgi:glutamate racemase